MAASFWQNTVLARADSPTSDTPARCLDSAAAIPISVARVTDGDTVVLSDGRRIRIIGINTLELNSTTPRDKQWALAAKAELETLIHSKRVSLVIGIEEFDRHGRTLAHLQLDDGSSVAEVLISKGLGLSITVGSNQRCALEYEQSEQLARQARLGIWKKPGSWLSREQKLTSRARGFRLIASRVINVQEYKTRTTLELNNGLRVTLNKLFFAALSETANAALDLQGRRVEVRGWLGLSSGKQHITLSHPTNLRVLSD